MAPRWCQRLYARVVASATRGDDPLADRRHELLAGLEGTVLEIGPGAGANLQFFPKDIRWIGVEPNPYMEAYLREAADRAGMAIEIRRGTAERLPVDGASVDAVVATGVLCSVRDQARSLAEILRVLRPGGRFVFIEHVAAPRGSAARLVQTLAQPAWGLIAGGCHVTRETWSAIERAGFVSVHIERFQQPGVLTGPHIAGVALKNPEEIEGVLPASGPPAPP